MTRLHAAAIGAEILSAVTAVAAARRRADYAPAAVALSALLAANLIQLATYEALPAPGELITGTKVALVWMDNASIFATQAVIPGLALALCTKSRKWPLLALGSAWAALTIAVGAMYPSPLVRGDNYARVLLATDLLGLLVASGAIGMMVLQKRRAGLSLLVLFILLFADVAVLVTPYSPWRGAYFFGRYDLIQIMLVTLFLALASFQGVLWKFSAR